MLKNGTYTQPLNIQCGVNAKSGLPGQPITVKAENERQALLTNDIATVLEIKDCSYWTIEGLRAEQPKVAQLYPGGVFQPKAMTILSSGEI